MSVLNVMQTSALTEHRGAHVGQVCLAELECRRWGIRAHARLQEIPSTGGATVAALRETAPTHEDGKPRAWTMLDYLLAEEILLVLLAAMRVHHESELTS